MLTRKRGQGLRQLCFLVVDQFTEEISVQCTSLRSKWKICAFCADW